ncbi:hypothetical protein AC578_4035 [Pseudocercospora eumusae]|uniref:Uncharacterized protein n=1 Tax=Pseudocercospora eumusae TaxID=321146 RepID=A0A139HDV9_9PEZI|nr:hypothetical protein AC578_4035 [Pseudocercospora eumusae]
MASVVLTWCQNVATKRVIDLLWLLYACILGGYNLLDPTHSTADNKTYRYLDSSAHLLEHTLRSRLQATPRLRAPAIQSHRTRVRHSNVTFPDLLRFLLPRLLKRIFLPCLLLYLFCRWRRGAQLEHISGPPQYEDLHHQNIHHHNLSGPTIDEACLHTCTSPEWLRFAAPPHPQILWLTPKTPEFAPDWLQRVYVLSDLRSDGATFLNEGHYPKFYFRDVRELAARVGWAASVFVHGSRNKNVLGARQGVREPLDLHQDTINAVSRMTDAESNPVYRFLSSFNNLHNIIPDESQSLRHLMSWSTNTTMLDAIRREYKSTSSLVTSLRTQILHNVHTINHAIAQKQDIWGMSNECQTFDLCLQRWQPALDDLRDLSALADFIDLNLSVTWHMLDALAFFTRIALDFDLVLIKQIYTRRRLQAITRRAGLYAARKWTSHYQNQSSICSTKCRDSSIVWKSWWEPYPSDDPAQYHHFRDPHTGLPITLPPRYKPLLLHEHCLGLDHLLGDDHLDSRVKQEEMEIDDPKERNSRAQEVLGHVWCIEDEGAAKKIEGLGYVNARAVYWDDWGKGWKGRRERREFVDEAWGEG